MYVLLCLWTVSGDFQHSRPVTALVPGTFIVLVRMREVIQNNSKHDPSMIQEIIPRWSRSHPKIIPNSSRHDPKVIPKWFQSHLPKLSKSHQKIVSKSSKSDAKHTNFHWFFYILLDQLFINCHWLFIDFSLINLWGAECLPKWSKRARRRPKHKLNFHRFVDSILEAICLPTGRWMVQKEQNVGTLN